MFLLVGTVSLLFHLYEIICRLFNTNLDDFVNLLFS